MRGAALTALPLLLSACAGLVEERGFATVQTETRAAIGQEVSWIRTDEERNEARARVAALLAEPLTADAAVAIALLNNRGLQADFHRLGLSAASLVAALTPPNPGFSFGRLRGGGVLELERAVTLDLLGLLTLPIAAAIEERRWEQAKLEALEAVLRTASEARLAFVGAVAAEQILAYMEQARDASETSAEMARRLGLAGTYGRMQQAREQVFHAELLVQYARARRARTAARERLARALGLREPGQQLRLPDRMPDPPAKLPERTDLEARAMTSRIDIRMARMEVEGLARSYGLTQATRFVNVLEAGWQDKRETGSPRARGYEIAVTVPIFDFGTTRVAQAEHTYLAAVHDLAAKAVAARSEVRERYDEYRLGWDLVQHYRRTVVPGRKVISDEQLLRYNGMLVGVFELLADARDQIAAVIAAIEAERDWWEAETALEMTLLGVDAGRAGGSTTLAASSRRPGGGH